MAAPAGEVDLHRSDAVVFTMEGAYDYIKEQHWERAVPRSKVHYINNGVDLELFEYNKANFPVEDPDLDDPDTFKVVYTGSIRQVNGLGLLLDAAKEVGTPGCASLFGAMATSGPPWSSA